MPPSTPQVPRIAHDLDAQLRQDASARRALLERQPYPVGTYHPRQQVPRPWAETVADRAGLWGTLGLGGLAVTGLGLAAALLWTMPSLTVDPSFGFRADASTISPPLLAPADPRRVSEGALPLGRGVPVDPWAVLDETARLGLTLDEAGLAVEQPIRDEFAALGEDIKTAADFFLQQWGGEGEERG